MSISGSAAAPPDPPDASPDAPLRLHLVRHGESSWNAEGRIQGQLDPPLSPRGIEQARRLAERLCHMHFDAFYSSDLQRCMQTPACVAEALGTAPVPIAGLREIQLGDWEGLSRDELQRSYPDLWERWRQWPSWDLVPGGEGASAFENRVRDNLQDLIARHPAGDVLVVTHGGVIQAALAEVVDRNSDGPFPFRIDNASLTVVQHRQGRVAVTRVNDTCHLT